MSDSKLEYEKKTRWPLMAECYPSGIKYFPFKGHFLIRDEKMFFVALKKDKCNFIMHHYELTLAIPAIYLIVVTVPRLLLNLLMYGWSFWSPIYPIMSLIELVGIILLVMLWKRQYNTNYLKFYRKSRKYA